MGKWWLIIAGCAAVDAQWRVRGAAGSAWGAMHCLGHYAKVRRTAGVRLQPTIDTREDTCTRSPSSMHRRTHETTSVVLVPSLRIAYVEILKGASSTVRQMLSSAFKANYDTCGGRTLPPYVKDAATSCGTQSGDDRMRCTTSCLTPSEVEEYFFFSFMRDPIERFLSGLYMINGDCTARPGEARCATFKAQMSDPTQAMAIVNSTLQRIINCQANRHFESQAALLTSPLAFGPALPVSTVSDEWRSRYSELYRVPLDFLGRVSHLQEDWRDMLRSAAARHLNR